MHSIIVKQFGIQSYSQVLTAMQEFTHNRNFNTPDQIWCLQHYPVYTLGLQGNSDHILNKTEIPVIKTDRGGQVTYHGPGQLVVYLLLDMQRHNLKVKQYVSALEQAMIDLCQTFGLHAHVKTGAPGVYLDNRKIGALGIRVKKGYCYHGIALNVDMDLTPFKSINPCGYPGLEVTQLADHDCHYTVEDSFRFMLPSLIDNLDLHAPLLEDNIMNVAPGTTFQAA